MLNLLDSNKRERFKDVSNENALFFIHKLKEEHESKAHTSPRYIGMVVRSTRSAERKHDV